jgi:hypothetical protein
MSKLPNNQNRSSGRSDHAGGPSVVATFLFPHPWHRSWPNSVREVANDCLKFQIAIGIWRRPPSASRRWNPDAGSFRSDPSELTAFNRSVRIDRRWLTKFLSGFGCTGFSFPELPKQNRSHLFSDVSQIMFLGMGCQGCGHERFRHRHETIRVSKRSGCTSGATICFARVLSMGIIPPVCFIFLSFAERTVSRFSET